jgi:hypothetical protein
MFGNRPIASRMCERRSRDTGTTPRRFSDPVGIAYQHVYNKGGVLVAAGVDHPTPHTGRKGKQNTGGNHD